MNFWITTLIILSLFLLATSGQGVNHAKKARAYAHLESLHKANPPRPPHPKVSLQLKASLDGRMYRPVVLMHGIRGDITSMVDVEQWIQEAFPGIYTRRIQVGNGYWDSILMPMNDQVIDFCNQIHEDPNLRRGFNLIGFSQGTLVTRGYIERCNSPPVYNYISWAGPQGGLFGVPYIDNSYLDEYLGSLPYWGPVQSRLAPAQFWKDPYDMSDYYTSSLYLPDINNELPNKNETYKKHITSLNHMVLVYSTEDEIIHPRESGWFWFYKPGTQELVPLKDSDFYKEDWIGLRTLDEQNKLYFGKTNCTHTGHKHEPCRHYFNIHTLPFLNNTLN